jgi:uncharacterized protein (TIGR00730 family)
MTVPNSVCVYCGASDNVDPAYREAASAVGHLLGTRGIRLVYGGGRAGLMGLVADAALAAGGHVTGIIPRHLETMEVAHRGLSHLHVVETMLERKAMMAALSDGFVVLPGGLGTLDEMFEILTWGYLGLHSQPIVIVNVRGFWNPLLGFLKGSAEAGFIRPDFGRLFSVVADIDGILPALVARNGADGVGQDSH